MLNYCTSSTKEKGASGNDQAIVLGITYIVSICGAVAAFLAY